MTASGFGAFMAFFLSCMQPTLRQAQAAPLAADVPARVEKIYSSIAAMDGQYSLERIPTETFINEYARDTKKRPADVRGQLVGHLKVRWAWKATGERFLETNRLGEKGEPIARTTLAFDGARHTKLQTQPSLDGGFPVATSEVGGNVLGEYRASAGIEQVLGLDMGLGTEISLAARSRENAKFVSEDGIVNIDVAFEADGMQQRLTGQLDALKGFAIVGLQHKVLHDNRWCLITARESNQFEKADGRVAGSAFWFPRKTVSKRYNIRGDHTFTETLEINSLRVNADLAPSQFRPEIRIGSQVHDSKTGSVSFQGNRASAEVDRAIAARVAQAKQQVQSLPSGANTATALPPVGPMQVLAIVAALVGVATLAGSLWIWLRSRSSA